MADRYAIIVGTSHHEPLMVASSLEWNDKRDGPWQYDVNGSRMREVMENRVREVAPFENIYSIGLRDNADKGMKSEGGLDYQMALMERIFADQRAILEKAVQKPADRIPQAFTAYKEVLDLLNNGLKVPDDVILVWPDDNYGYISQLNSDIQRMRKGGAGLYYHLNYVGRPYSIGWIGSPSPEQIREELNKAYGNGVQKLWLFNVGDIKPYAFETSYCLDLAWDFPYNDTQVTQNYMKHWISDVFGPELADEMVGIMNAYYQAAFDRKTEFMGWNRSEPNTPTVNTQYSLHHYHDLQRRLRFLDSISIKVKGLQHKVPDALKATYFELCYYPVVAADLVNKKMLYGQMNRLFGDQGYTASNLYGQLSSQMNDSLESLTAAYNQLLNAKWKGIMPLQSTGTLKTPLVKVKPEQGAVMALDWEGHETVAGLANPESLPVFSKYYKDPQLISVFNKGEQQFIWEVTADQPWIQVSKKAGVCDQIDSFWVSIDRSQLPHDTLPQGHISVTGAGSTRTLRVQVFNPMLPVDSLKGLFVERNGVVSIYAADYQRKNNKLPYQWVQLHHLGRSGNVMKMQTDTLAQVPYEWELTSHAPSLEYDFYTFNQGWVDVHSFTLPTHAINLQRGCLYGLSIDNQPPKIIDFSTRGRTEDWMVGVMSNTQRQISRHYINRPGRHTLKVWVIDPDVCFDKFVIDAGGLKNSYGGPVQSRL